MDEIWDEILLLCESTGLFNVAFTFSASNIRFSWENKQAE